MVRKVEAGIRGVTERSGIVVKDAKNTVDTLTKERESVVQESEMHAKRIDELDRKRGDIDCRIAEAKLTLASIEMRSDQYCRQLQNDCVRCQDQIDEVERIAVDKCKELQKEVVSVNAALSPRLRDSKSLRTLASCKKDFQRLARVTEELLSPLARIEETIAEFVPATADTDIGHLRRRHFTSVKKVTDLSFPVDPACRVIQAARYLLDGGVVALGQAGSNEWADTIYIWNNEKLNTCQVITEGVHPARDIAVTSSGDVMVLRMTDPLIRVFNLRTGGTNDIHASLSQDAMNESRYLETDLSNAIFVGYGNPERRLLALDIHGGTLAHVEIGLMAREMSYDAASRVLYVAAGRKIARYQWNGNTLKEVLPQLDTVDGFYGWDICTSSTGEIYVAGWLENASKVIVIYQLMEQGTGVFSLNRISFDDEIARSNVPYISVQDRQLILGYEDTVQVFNLLT
jgi:hypothetical protein